MSIQLGPFNFLSKRNISRLDVLVPNTWLNVSPSRSLGSWGRSACLQKKRSPCLSHLFNTTWTKICNMIIYWNWPHIGLPNNLTRLERPPTQMRTPWWLSENIMQFIAFAFRLTRLGQRRIRNISEPISQKIWTLNKVSKDFIFMGTLQRYPGTEKILVIDFGTQWTAIRHREVKNICYLP